MNGKSQHPLQSAAILGLALCALLAVLVPSLDVLQPIQTALHRYDDDPPSVQQTANSSVSFSGGPPTQPSTRDNATIEAALEATVMGAFLADAASLGMQGVYDLEQMEALLRQNESRMAPQEFREPLNLEYEAPKGGFSAYAYETLPIMHTLMSQRELEAGQFAADCAAFFGGYTGHVNADMRRWARNVKRGLTGAAAAVDGDGAHALIKVPLLVARYAAHADMQERLRAAVRVHQRSERAALAARALAAVLERMAVLGVSVREAAEWAAGEGSGLREEARGWLGAVLREGPGLTPVQGVARFGRGGGAVEALQSGLHVALAADGFVAGVRASIMAGGNCTARAHVVGSLLGAQHGEAALPAKWRHKAVKFLDVKQMVHVTIVQRSQFVPIHINRDPGAQTGAGHA